MANEVISNFVNRVGKSSSPGEKTHLAFDQSMQQSIWERLLGEIGVGYFGNGFYYLFGEQLLQLSPVLEHWNFLLAAEVDYTLLGFNKMGFLVLGEDLGQKGMGSQVAIVDPFQVRLYRNPQVKLLNFVGRWLPDGLIPHLNDRTVYDAYTRSGAPDLAFDEIIAIKTPLSLGGSMAADNFAVEPILDYFQSTGEVYARALGKSGGEGA